MKIVGIVAIVIVVLAGAAIVAPLLGAVDVAADVQDSRMTDWYLSHVRDRSIEARVGEIHVPGLEDPGRVHSGAVAFDAMCAGCHGAPGRERSPVGAGLNPEPPDLAEAGMTSEEQLAEAFWVVKHGVRMTGMPAFGLTHHDDELWDLVAFVGELPSLSPHGYESMLREAGVTLESGDHGHEPGHAGHEDTVSGGS